MNETESESLGSSEKVESSSQFRLFGDNHPPASERTTSLCWLICWEFGWICTARMYGTQKLGLILVTNSGLNI